MATKQEEIREGLYNWFTLNRDTNDADGVLAYLHSQGVVIKVDRELPDFWIETCPSANSDTCKTCDNCEIYWFAMHDIIDAGYGFFEPLINEN